MGERRAALAATMERISEVTGRMVAWLTLIMVLTTFVVVVLRYFFSLGYIWLQEIGVYLHALVFLLGAAYTLARDEHVRVDIFYRRMRSARRRLVDVLGTLFFLLPTSGFVIFVAWDYVTRSWVDHESSRQTGGLPYPFVPLLKSAILVACVLLAIQGLAWLLRGGRMPSDPGAERETDQAGGL